MEWMALSAAAQAGPPEEGATLHDPVGETHAARNQLLNHLRGTV